MERKNTRKIITNNQVNLRIGKPKKGKNSRGPLDGFLEAFYRPPTDARTRERKPPRIQRFAETS